MISESCNKSLLKCAITSMLILNVQVLVRIVLSYKNNYSENCKLSCDASQNNCVIYSECYIVATDFLFSLILTSSITIFFLVLASGCALHVRKHDTIVINTIATKPAEIDNKKLTNQSSGPHESKQPEYTDNQSDNQINVLVKQ